MSEFEGKQPEQAPPRSFDAPGMEKEILAFWEEHKIFEKSLEQTKHPSAAEAKEDEPNAGEFFEVARKIALAQKKAFGADIVRSQIYGEQVEHAHIWIWPETVGDEKNFSENAKKIIASII